MTLLTITRSEAQQLKPFLEYMDFGNVRENRKFLVKNMMFENMLQGNIKRSFIGELRANFIKQNPDAELPEILKE
jgi:hypothetical protein